MLLALLCVTLATSTMMSGCSEKPNNTTTNACLGNESVIFADNIRFAQDLIDCSKSSMGAAHETSTCLASKYPSLSQKCTECFGSLAECGRSNCTGKCMFNVNSAACINCGTQNCRCDLDAEGKATSFSLTRCTGLSIEKQPIKTAHDMEDLVLTCPAPK